ncbi:CAP domain-containing protein [Sorangium sp. So ce375]|uniref:CAP domain-containing protein n=1 Tax=Sorangium sp. So ce375 TaxID=3133306 RepID=UPI003F5BFAD8
MMKTAFPRFRLFVSTGLLVAAAAACSSEDADPGAQGSSSGSPSVSGSGGTAASSGGAGPGSGAGGAGGASTGSSSAGSTATAGGGGSPGATSAGSGGTAPDTGDRSPEGTCARFNADTADMSEGTWSGSLDPECDPGDISADGRANALRLFNLYRWLADLPAVVTEPTRDAQAQACALMMDANNSLSHEPPKNWKCYSEAGANGARTSNISSGPGVESVQGYLIDRGNESTFGHRRIILANDLGPIGLGSTGKNGASCMQNIGGTGKAGKEWTAWPPPGVFPIQAYADFWGSLSDTGWSIQSEDIKLADAEVTISSGGAPLAVDVEPLQGNYGSTNGIRVVPNGWDPEAGKTYSVSVSGVSATIAYDVVFVDCE